jgi:hypothetical protein
VFALRLNRRKFAKNPNDSIRCKFSIDGGFRRRNGRNRRVHHFETIPAAVWKPDVHHLHRLNPRNAGENPVDTGCFTAGLRALAFA